MILTVGMSPCVDVTVRLNKFALGKTNVAGEKIVTYAGKANNVALGVSRLGGAAFVTGFMYNENGSLFEKALDKEGKAILGNVRKGAAIVAMCIEGKQISSEELAQFLADRAGSGAGDVAFVIGSSHGLADEVKRAAALKFSMGRITMPHQLARLVLTEQIYRACTINAGMKYHK